MHPVANIKFREVLNTGKTCREGRYKYTKANIKRKKYQTELFNTL